jgi:hypothetical protein
VDSTGNAVTQTFVFYRDATPIGQFTIQSNAAVNGASDGIKGEVFDTPPVGSHTYAVKAFVSANSTSVRAGAGATGTKVPAFLRVTRADPQVVVSYVSVPQPAVGTQRKTTPKPVNSTIAATDLLNGEITIGAGVLSSTGVLRLTADGDWLQHTGGNAAPPRFQLVIGGTTIIDTGTGTMLLPDAANRYGWHLEVVLRALNATNAQWARISGVLAANSPNIAQCGDFATGEGRYGNVYSGGALMAVMLEGGASGSKDMTASQTLVLNVINGSASASYETRLLGALVEIL